MAQSRRRRQGRPGHRRPRGGRPRRLGQAAARLARLRDRASPARTRPSTSARTSTTPTSRRAPSWCCPRSRSRPTSARRPRARKQWWSGNGDDLDTTMTRSVDPARPAPGQPVVPGQLGHRGLRLPVRRVTTPYVEVNDGTGCKADRRLDHHGRRGQRHRRRQQRAGSPATFDLSALRRQDGRPAVPLPHRRRRRRAARASSPTRSP